MIPELKGVQPELTMALTYWEFLVATTLQFAGKRVLWFTMWPHIPKHTHICIYDIEDKMYVVRHKVFVFSYLAVYKGVLIFS